MFNAEKYNISYINVTLGKMLSKVSNIFNPIIEKEATYSEANLANFLNEIPKEIVSFIASLPKKVLLDQIVYLLNNIDSRMVLKSTIILAILTFLVACNPSASNGSEIGIPGNGTTETATKEPTTEKEVPTITPEQPLSEEEIEKVLTIAAEEEPTATPDPSESFSGSAVEYIRGLDNASEIFTKITQLVAELQSQDSKNKILSFTVEIDENSTYIQVEIKRESSNLSNTEFIINSETGEIVASLSEAKSKASELKLTEPNDLGFDVDGNITADSVDEEGNSTQILLLAELEEGSDTYEWMDIKKIIPLDALNAIEVVIGKNELIKIEANLIIINNVIYDESGTPIAKLIQNKEGETKWHFATVEQMMSKSKSIVAQEDQEAFNTENKKIHIYSYMGEDKKSNKESKTSDEFLKNLNLLVLDKDKTNEFITFCYENTKNEKIPVIDAVTGEKIDFDVKNAKEIIINIINIADLPTNIIVDEETKIKWGENGKENFVIFMVDQEKPDTLIQLIVLRDELLSSTTFYEGYGKEQEFNLLNSLSLAMTALQIEYKNLISSSNGLTFARNNETIAQELSKLIDTNARLYKAFQATQ